MTESAAAAPDITTPDDDDPDADPEHAPAADSALQRCSEES